MVEMGLECDKGLNKILKELPAYHPHFDCPYLKVFASKQLYTHDGEYKPKDQTHQQHIEDGRDGLH